MAGEESALGTIIPRVALPVHADGGRATNPYGQLRRPDRRQGLTEPRQPSTRLVIPAERECRGPEATSAATHGLSPAEIQTTPAREVVILPGAVGGGGCIRLCDCFSRGNVHE